MIKRIPLSAFLRKKKEERGLAVPIDCQAVTSVPTFSPYNALVMDFESHRLTTRIGILFYMHRVMAVLSITSRRRFRTSI